MDRSFSAGLARTIAIIDECRPFVEAVRAAVRTVPPGMGIQPRFSRTPSGRLSLVLLAVG